MLLLLALFCLLQGSLCEREGRLGLLSIVKFANDPCGASNGSNGTCLTSDECSSRSGVASGTCADGFGVCCVLSIGCGGSTTTNNTYITQAATTSATTCTYTICPATTDICQIRIEFETFKMAGASTTAGSKGQCADDSLTISNPSGPNPPLVCGVLTGQHMYLDASSSCHKITAMVGSTDTTTSREWSIRVQQIECGNPSLAPAGCLQYHTGTTGYIYNFGWQGTSALSASTTAHQNNQNYRICFRREEGYCSMQYFAAETGFVMDGAIASQAEYGDSCTTDYLTIPGLKESPSTATTAFVTAIGDRICGLAWKYPANPGASKTLVTFQTPFTVGVNFNSEDDTRGTDSQNGFAVLFTQAKCA